MASGRRWPDELDGIGLGDLCAPNRLDYIARAYDQAAAASPYLLRHFSLKASIFRADEHRDAIVAATSRQKVAKARHRVESAKDQLIAIVRDAELDRSKSTLNRLREHEVKYREAVAAENAATSECLRVEGMGLESMEYIEIERLRRIFDAKRWDFSASSREESGDAPKSPLTNVLDMEETNCGSPKTEQRDSSRAFDDPSVLIRKFSSSFAFGASNHPDPDDLNMPSLDDVLSEETRNLRSKSHVPDRLQQICRLQKAISAASQSLMAFADTPIHASDSLPDVYSSLWDYMDKEKERARGVKSTLDELHARLEGQRSVIQRNEASWKQLCDATRSPVRERSRSWDKGAILWKDAEIPTHELVALSSDAFRQSANNVIDMLAKADTIKEELEAVLESTASGFQSSIALTREQIEEAISQWSERLQANATKRLKALEYESRLSESLRKSLLELTPPPSPASVAVPENSASKWLSLMISDSSESLFGSRKSREEAIVAVVDIETKIFRECFCKRALNTLVVRSIACSCEQRFGRLFLLDSSLEAGSKLIFVSWKGRKIAFPSNIDSVRHEDDKEDTGVGSSILLSTSKGSCRLSHISDADMAVSLIEELNEGSNDAENSSKPGADDANVVTDDASADQTSEEDAVVQRMEPILSAELHGTSITEYYDKVWSESTPFYKPWLEQQCFDVELEPWVNEQVQNQWSQEIYQRQRRVGFKYKRTTHLYIGPPVAHVKQTHYCRIEGHSKCVLQMTMEFVGIPYADCFTVEIRWVARSLSPSVLKIDVGATVIFQKPTFLRSKISSATIEETRPTHESLFRAVESVLIDNVETKREKVLLAPSEAEPSVSTSASGSSSRFGYLQHIDLRTKLTGFLLVAVFFIYRSEGFRKNRHGGLSNCHEPFNEMEKQMAVMANELRELKESLMEIKALLLTKEIES